MWQRGWERKRGHRYSLSLLFPGGNIGTQIFNKRNTEGGLAKGSMVIRRHKSGYERERPYGGSRKWGCSSLPLLWLNALLPTRVRSPIPPFSTPPRSLPECQLKYLALFWALLNQQDVSDLEGIQMRAREMIKELRMPIIQWAFPLCTSRTDLGEDSQIARCVLFGLGQTRRCGLTCLQLCCQQPINYSVFSPPNGLSLYIFEKFYWK